ncbi:HD-GYP domain-containing protein [Pseudodesulfovibrio tunisiensis]|uniref:HD-GYP domain-containing protein n=1 Tax=Pseudodesulfovibrio tunisiensis TaxID=463192 RepID=UPI001FB1DF81|nr:HD-GYP domain-containing protein [Pseudodesulfovibrio tunisiensis]
MIAEHRPRLQLEDICEFQILDAVHMTVHQFAESLGNVIDAKDHCTRSHSEEVAVVSQAIGLELGLSARQADILHVAGHLHDIGKIGIPDAILKKQGPLTSAEFEIIKQHPQIGAGIMAPVTGFSGTNGVVRMILHHHERFDGTGYPHGLPGLDIPLGARIIAVADSLSAMLQNRPYRKALSYGQAVEEIARCSGSQFDPLVVEALLEIRDTVRDYLRTMRDLRVAV